jgi:hypothetical protein
VLLCSVHPGSIALRQVVSLAQQVHSVPPRPKSQSNALPVTIPLQELFLVQDALRVQHVQQRVLLHRAVRLVIALLDQQN